MGDLLSRMGVEVRRLDSSPRWGNFLLASWTKLCVGRENVTNTLNCGGDE